MSWLRNSSIGASLGKLRGTTSPSKDFDISACYDSFRKHWQQINDIIVRTQAGDKIVKSDDILAVVSNLDHMVTLLILELKSNGNNNPCLEHVLSENLLDCLYEWSLTCGKFVMALRMEQLKLYEVLVSHSHTQLLVHEAFHRPLLRLLMSSSDTSFNEELDKRLVVLLNQLCVSLVHHKELLQLFFHCNNSGNESSFIIFSLLIPFIHRDGAVGQQARDALLFCMSLSKQNENVAQFIAHHSNVCPVLATGLSGLYSSLPCKHIINLSSTTRLTPEDINETEELSSFMNSLEFCNAVLQVAHPSVCSHLLEFLYQGFLVPVMGPALLQNSEPELTTSTAYFDLFLRSLSEPGLIHSFVRFIFKESYDDQIIIDALMQRINANSKLSIVTLSLFENLISLNCEDVMLELIFKYLIPCNHVMASQKTRINSTESYGKSAERLLHLSPMIERSENVEGSLYGDYLGYLLDARKKINSSAYATSVWEYSYDGESPSVSMLMQNTLHFTETEGDHSLLSVDDVSSGYESFIKPDFASEPGSGPESYSPTNSDIGTGSKNTQASCNTIPSVGPFIEALFAKLEKMLSLDVTSNLQLTGVISRLSVFPQPLLRSFLLDNSLVFQPSIKCLFQIVGLLKQKIELGLKNISNDELKCYIEDCETDLFERERLLMNTRKQISANSLPPSINDRHESFDRNDNKRKSLTASLNAVFRRTTATAQPSSGCVKYSTKNPEIRKIVMCAILLNEWLRELAAISQEHAVFFLSSTK